MFIQFEYVSGIASHRFECTIAIHEASVEDRDFCSVQTGQPAIYPYLRHTQNPRSTVGTITEIYDLLRLMFSRIGHPHCPECGLEVSRQSVEEIVDKIWKINHKVNVTILAPIVREQKGSHRKIIDEVRKANYYQVRVDGILYNIEEAEQMDMDKQKKHTVEVVVDRILLDNDKETKAQLFESVKVAADLGNGLVVILRSDEPGDTLFSQYYTCPKCDIDLPEVELRSFSFNSPFGACSVCSGLGVKMEVDPELVISNPRLTLAEGAIKPWTKIFSNQTYIWQLLAAVAKRHRFSLDVPVEALSAKALEIVLFGTGDEPYEVGGKPMTFEGVLPGLEAKHKESDSDYIRKEIERYMRQHTCPSCEGKRLKKESLAVTVGGLSIVEYTETAVIDLKNLIKEVLTSAKYAGQKIPKKEFQYITEPINATDLKIAGAIVKEIERRLEFLENVGLDYLTLGRSATTLSGGEAQRIRLATQLGSSLSEVIYVLDEPSIGLHPADNKTPLAKELITKRQIVFDVVYSPYETKLLREAKQQGARIIHGMDMLLEQAMAQFELFTKRRAPQSPMRNVLLRHLPTKEK